MRGGPERGGEGSWRVGPSAVYGVAAEGTKRHMAPHAWESGTGKQGPDAWEVTKCGLGPERGGEGSWRVVPSAIYA